MPSKQSASALPAKSKRWGRRAIAGGEEGAPYGRGMRTTSSEEPTYAERTEVQRANTQRRPPARRAVGGCQGLPVPGAGPHFSSGLFCARRAHEARWAFRLCAPKATYACSRRHCALHPKHTCDQSVETRAPRANAPADREGRHSRQSAQHLQLIERRRAQGTLPGGKQSHALPVTQGVGVHAAVGTQVHGPIGCFRADEQRGIRGCADP